MPVTQSDIAKQLNLSQSTVTKVLNNRKDVWVSDENRRRILAMARELNYRPNSAARALRYGQYKSVTIVFLAQPLVHMRSAYSQAVEVLAERLGEIGYELKVKVFPSHDRLIEGLKDIAASRDTDIVVLWGSEPLVEEQGSLLESSGIPFVVKGRFELTHPEWRQVDFDHEKLMEVIVDYLARQGHRKIAYIGNDLPDVYARRLLVGFREAMLSRGIEVCDELVVEIPAKTENVEQAVICLMALDESARPSALALGTGGIAWVAVEEALARIGRKMGDGPGDICVAGTGEGDPVLSLGNAICFDRVAFDSLAVAMFEGLLRPMLSREDPPQPIVRIVPELRPIPSRNLLRYVGFK